MNISVNYSGNNSPIQRYHGQLINRTDETDYVDMIDETNAHRHTPSIDIYYQRNLKKDQVLIFDVVGTCNKEFSDRTYQESRDNVLLTDVQNTVYGKKYSLIGEGIYEKKLANGMRWGAGIRHTHSFSNNDYLNGHNYHTRMQQGSTYLYGEVRGKAKRLDYMLGIGGTRSFYRQEGSVDLYQYYTFNPRLTLKYTFNDRSYLRLRSSISNEMPSLGNLSAIDQVVDSLQIQRGNPNLEAYLHYSNTLDGEWSKGIFYTYFSLACHHGREVCRREQDYPDLGQPEKLATHCSDDTAACRSGSRYPPVLGKRRIESFHQPWQHLPPQVLQLVARRQCIRQLEKLQLHVSDYDQPELVQRRDIERRRKCPDYHAELQVERPADRSRYVQPVHQRLQDPAGKLEPLCLQPENKLHSGKCPDGLPHLKLQLLVRASLQECQQENQQPGFRFRHHADREIEFLPKKRLDVSMKTSVRLNQKTSLF